MNPTLLSHPTGPIYAGLHRLLPTYIVSLLSLLLSTVAFGQVQITKSVSASTVAVGTPFTYTLQINCPSITGTCNNVVVTDPLPASLQYNGASAPTGNVQSITYNASTNTVTITMNPVLNGTTDEVQLSVGFKTGSITGTVATNTAYGGPGNTSPSNTVSTTATNGATPPAFTNSVSLIKTADDGTGGPNSGFQYEYAISNQSNQTLNNLVVEDIFPANQRVSTLNDVYFPGGSTAVPYQLYYQTNTNSTYQIWPGGPWDLRTGAFHNVTTLGLPAGTYVTAIRYNYGPIPGDGSFFNSAATPNATRGTFRGTNVGATGETMTNCLTGTGELGTTTTTITPACVTTTVNTPKLAVFTNKSIGNPKSGYLVGDTVRFFVDYGNNVLSGLDIQNPIITDLLPPELQFVSYSVANLFNTTPLGSSSPFFAPAFSQVDNYNNTAATLLRFNFNGLTIPNDPNGGTPVFRITINTVVRTGIPVGTYTNTASFSQDYVGPLFCKDAVDTDDINGNGSTTDTLCVRAVPFNVVVPAGAGLESTKFVKGTLDADFNRFPASGNTVPGGQANYRLRVKNVGTIPMRNIVVIDILPFIGDRGVIDLSPRLTQWRPSLIAPVTTSAANVTILYSTAQNPCRDELTPGVPSPCDAPNWSATLPADPTTVQSLKFDFGSTVLQPNDSINLFWAMRAPIDGPTNGEIAWNSFGYIATRADNGSTLLATEPIKVGIKLLPVEPAGYGNYVWQDVNANGIQDEDPSLGINGVRVDLYVPRGATPNPATDSLVTFTLTSSKNGNPGFYQFTSLQPGNYYAVFHKPIGSLITTRDNAVTPDDSLDSDGIQTIIGGDTLAITAITDISVGEFDNRWDQGFTLGPICTLSSLTISPGLCDPLSNAYTLTGSVSLTNAAAQSLTITDGTQTTTVSITAGQTSAGFSLTGLVSNEGSRTVTVTSLSGICGTTSTTYTAPASCSVALAGLGDFVFLDVNQNGVQDAGDTPISGVVVTLYTNGVASLTTLTDGSGAYSFTGLTPGSSLSYSVGFGTPTGLTPTTANVGGDDTDDSDADAVTGRTQSVTLAGGDFNPTLDAGFFSSCSVGTPTVTVGPCLTATNTYSTTAVVSIQNPAGGQTLTISNGATSQPFTTTAGSSNTFTMVFSGLTSDGAAGTITATLPGCGSATTQYTAPISCSVTPTPPVLTLEKLVSNSTAQVGNVLTYSLVLTNTGSVSATTTVRDSLSGGSSYVVNSAVAPAGTTFTPGTPVSLWSVPSLAAGQSLTLTFQVLVDSMGVLYNSASIPGDTANVCTSVPVRVCTGSNYAYLIEAPAGYADYQFYNGSTLVYQGPLNSYTATTAGSYSIAITSLGGCPSPGSCCPVIIEEVAPPSFTVVATNPTCLSDQLQANGQLTVNGLAGTGYTYQYSAGATFNAATATAVTSVPGNGVLVNNLSATQTYTVRVYNQTGCFSDVTVTITAPVCACPPATCVPIVVTRTRGQIR